MRKQMLSAVSLTSLLTTGCLIPEPPEYGEPEQTPIYIVDSSVFPNPRNVLTLSTVEDIGTQFFRLSAHSEDDGEDVIAALHANYKHEGGTPLTQVRYQSTTFDVEKTISLPLSIPDRRLDAPGCYAITLMVLHETGWNDVDDEPIGLPSDSVTWFVALTDGVTTPSLESCPNIDTEDSMASPPEQ